jgi:hypothetical protein
MSFCVTVPSKSSTTTGLGGVTIAIYTAEPA